MSWLTRIFRYDALAIAERRLGAGQLRRARAAADDAIVRGVTGGDLSRALRVLGEVAEATCDTAEAARCYRRALEHDPKVAVRSQLAALERK